jgi:hypothetical protein
VYLFLFIFCVCIPDQGSPQAWVFLLVGSCVSSFGPFMGWKSFKVYHIGRKGPSIWWYVTNVFSYIINLVSHSYDACYDQFDFVFVYRKHLDPFIHSQIVHVCYCFKIVCDVLLKTSFCFTSKNCWLQSRVFGLQIAHDLQESIICKSNVGLAKHVEKILVEKVPLC